MPTRKFSDAAKSALLFIFDFDMAVEACSERARKPGGSRIPGGWNPLAGG